MRVEAAADDVARCGGIAARRRLACSDRTLRAALRRGALVRVRRGWYALPSVAGAPRVAAEASGVLSHTSAALDWGWSVARAPERAHVKVGLHRRMTAGAPGDCVLHYGQFSARERQLGRTDPLTTVLDCARTLPFAEALAVADSALRTSLVGREELLRAAERASGPGSRRVREVAVFADGGAANAFESGMRALCRGIEGLALRTQVWITDGSGFAARVDLADERLGLVLECDGFEFHGGRERFLRDRRRYTSLSMLGWVVFSFVWEDVFVTPDRTTAAISAWVDRALATPRDGAWRPSLAPGAGHA